MLETDKTNSEEIVRLMVGRSLGDIFNELEHSGNYGDVVLDVRNLCSGFIDNVSFQVHAGEILGLRACRSGRSETMKAIYGVDSIKSGEIFVDGRLNRFDHPSGAIECGIALMP